MSPFYPDCHRSWFLKAWASDCSGSFCLKRGIGQDLRTGAVGVPQYHVSPRPSRAFILFLKIY